MLGRIGHDTQERWNTLLSLTVDEISCLNLIRKYSKPPTNQQSMHISI